MMKANPNLDYRILSDAMELKAVEELQAIVWEGSGLVPRHLLVAIAHNGGIIIGAFESESLVGFVFGFPGVDSRNQQMKHCSHMLAVHPDFRNFGIGFSLKAAQWQLALKRDIDLITWTFDPLMSKNAFLNIVKLGTVCNTYQRDVYGALSDEINQGIATDRFQVDWWANSARVKRRMGDDVRAPLNLGDFHAAGAQVVNSTSINAAGLATPSNKIQKLTKVINDLPPVVMVEIPSNFLALKAEDINLAHQWRSHTREIFEKLIANQYIITDFARLQGELPRSYYVLTHGDASLGT